VARSTSRRSDLPSAASSRTSPRQGRRGDFCEPTPSTYLEAAPDHEGLAEDAPRSRLEKTPMTDTRTISQLEAEGYP
jgi:hypothetical protein